MKLFEMLLSFADSDFDVIRVDLPALQPEFVFCSKFTRIYSFDITPFQRCALNKPSLIITIVRID